MSNLQSWVIRSTGQQEKMGGKGKGNPVIKWMERGSEKEGTERENRKGKGEERKGEKEEREDRIYKILKRAGRRNL